MATWYEHEQLGDSIINLDLVKEVKMNKKELKFNVKINDEKIDFTELPKDEIALSPSRKVTLTPDSSLWGNFIKHNDEVEENYEIIDDKEHCLIEDKDAFYVEVDDEIIDVGVFAWLNDEKTKQKRLYLLSFYEDSGFDNILFSDVKEIKEHNEKIKFYLLQKCSYAISQGELNEN